MRRIGIAPRIQTFDDLKNNDWFAAVSERFNVYDLPTDPTTTDVPEDQWGIFRNTTTGVVALWMNFGGTMISSALQEGGSVDPDAIGYHTGVGGTTTQLITKLFPVTLNKICGQIVLAGDTLNANTVAFFTFTNSHVSSTDVVFVNRQSGGSNGSYNVWCDSVSNGSCVIAVHNVTAANLTESFTLNFSVFKSVTS